MNREEIERIINPEETARSLVGFRGNTKYFDKNYQTLREKYPDEFVAVYDQKVVGHGRNFSQLVESLNKENIDTGEVFIGRTYFKEKSPTLILRAA